VGLGVELATGVIEEESTGGGSMGGVFAGIDPVRGDADASSVRLAGDGIWCLRDVEIRTRLRDTAYLHVT
jgi:hypothetical protein